MRRVLCGALLAIMAVALTSSCAQADFFLASAGTQNSQGYGQQVLRFTTPFPPVNQGTTGTWSVFADYGGTSIQPYSVAVSPDATHLFVGTNDGGASGSIYEYNVASGASSQITLDSGLGRVWSLSVSGDGRYLYAADFDNSRIIQFDLSASNITGHVLLDSTNGIAHPTSVLAVGNELYVADYVAGNNQSYIDRFDLSKGNAREAFAANLSVPGGLAVNPAGTKIYVGIDNGVDPNTHVSNDSGILTFSIAGSGLRNGTPIIDNGIEPVNGIAFESANRIWSTTNNLSGDGDLLRDNLVNDTFDTNNPGVRYSGTPFNTPMSIAWISATAVPEPSSVLLLGVGLVGSLALIRRRARRA